MKKDEVVSTREKGGLIDEAKKRFEAASSFEVDNRKNALDDLQMLAGENHWPADVVREREEDGRPCLTVNKLPSFTDQVVNESRMNEISIHVKPYGGGATEELASTFNGLIRNIENVSDAEVAYQTALESAANNGFGYFRIVSDYTDETSFEQELRIARIRNPMTVYFDPAHTSHDGRDARFVFVTEMVSREEYKARYNVDLTPFKGGQDTLWFEEDRVRIAEYWTKEPKVKNLYLLSDGRTVEAEEWDSSVEDLKAQEKMIHLEPNPQNPEGPPIEVEGPAPEGSGYPETVLNPTPTIVRERKVNSHKVMQYLIDGEKVIESTEWPGYFIPIIPVWGKEIVVENKRHLRGVIRFAKDPQRMYNYFRSAATETVALAPKAPYIAEERQVEGHEDEWAASNRKNIPVLKYKAVPGLNSPPQRQIVTQTAIGEITESNVSDQEMKATTSMYGPSLGEPSNEVSGRAIMARQREGDIANFTYHSNLKRAVKFAGDILVDLIPKIYDTTRQIAIIRDDGEEEFVPINQPVLDPRTGEETTINDLTIGRYKVTVTTGPSFTTQREEAAASMLDFVRVAPDTAKFFIDLIAENMDWPGSVKIAKRIRRLLLPPDIDSDQPPAPQEPSVDDIIKQLRAQGINLANFKRQLDIVEKRRELEGMPRQAAEAGAQGAIDTIFGSKGGNNEGG